MAVSVQIDVQPAIDALAGTSKSIKQITSLVLRTIAKGATKQIKSVIRQTVHRRTGWMAGAYTYKVRANLGVVNIYPSRKKLTSDKTQGQIASARNLALAKTETLSYGNDIYAKRAKWLVFQNADGNWVKVKSVHIAPRGFVQAGQQYINDGKWDADVQKAVDKALEKYWGK